MNVENCTFSASELRLSNEEKLVLAMILDKAETEATTERESYLRSGDAESQFGTINGLTNRLKFINKMQAYCMRMEGVAIS